MNASYLFDLDLQSRSRTAKNIRNEKFLGENFFRIWNELLNLLYGRDNFNKSYASIIVYDTVGNEKSYFKY